MAIGETIVGAVLQVVFDRLASKEVINFFRRSKFDQFLVTKLKTLMLSVEKLMLDAEYKQFTDAVVRQWLDELQHWFYRAEEIVNEIATEALRSSIETPLETGSFITKVRTLIPSLGSTSSFSFETRVSQEIKQVIGMLETMLFQKDALGLRELSVGATTARDPLTHRIPTTCVMADPKVFGRIKERKRVLKFLLSDKNETSGKIGVIPIVGMGGIGKTTLAKLVYNHSTLENKFHVKVWVCVSDQFDVSRVTKSVLESILGQPYSGSPDLNFLQVKLSGELRDKRFLVVLDDVWSEDYESWECLRAPFSVGAYGSKIIVTTRNEGVASIMRTDPSCHLNTLSDEDAWSLFSRHAFDDGSSIPNPSLDTLGRKIVQKCRGLPLAIKTLAALLRFKRDIGQWETISQSTLWDLSYDKSHVIPALRLSYYHLPSHLKRCFSYCALFPKDYIIDRKQLVLLWMAENYVVSTDNHIRIEDVADDYVEQLLLRSLLEPNDRTSVKMHDLVHDLAEDVSRDFFTRHDRPSEFSNKARHFSYVPDTFDGFTRFQAIHESKHVRTFIGMHKYHNQSNYLSNKVPMELVPQLYCLRVLSLSEYENMLLPESIGSLKQLCYLDISGSKIKTLPESVSTLYNLQSLILSKCHRLQILPEDFGKLALLRHLDLTGTPSLLHMPRQMGKLKNLQTLSDFVVGKGSASTVQELREMVQIRDKLSLRRLQNVTTPADAGYANLCNREHLEELGLEFDDTEDNNDSARARVMLENLRPHVNLKRLSIRNYVGTRFPGWLDSSCQVHLSKMTFLCLSGCHYCQSLPPLGQLPSLKDLEIEGMNSIINVGSKFYGHNSALSGPFPVLVSLSFKKMKSWKVWSNVDAKGNAVWFPRLGKLSLYDCPELQGHLPIHIPLLEKLEISECEQLSSVLPRVPSIHPLEVAACPRADMASALNVRSIKSLRLQGLVQLEKLPSELERLLSLRYLHIEECNNLKSLENVRLLHKLFDLKIKECRDLKFLPKGMVFTTHLQVISLYKCPCLRWVKGEKLPTSLFSLKIDSCERLEFPIPMERMHEYTYLEYVKLSDTSRDVVSFPLGIFPNLQTLYLLRCKYVEKVYIPEEIDGNSLMALRSLFIDKCGELKMVGKARERGGEAATVLPAPNLTHLDIRGCEKVKPIVMQTEEELVFFPYLQFLATDKMPYGSLRLNQFSYLEYLYINKHNGEWFPDETVGCSLPASLKILHLWDFGKMKKIDGKVLQTLTSLQQLFIINCPELQGLPEEEFPLSLGCLDIFQCPLLEERCKPEIGQDWTKIKNIPCVHINGTCITEP